MSVVSESEGTRKCDICGVVKNWIDIFEWYDEDHCEECLAKALEGSE